MKRRKISTRIIALVLCTLMILITISPMQADEYNTQETADTTAQSTDSNAETNQTTGVETTEETASAEEATTETTEDAAKETGEASDAGEPAEETPDAEEPAEEAPVQKAVELKHEFTDENGSVVAAVTANIPEGAFNAETSAVSMEVTEVDTAMNDTVKALMEKSLASDKVLSNYFLYNVVFKVNGEITEPGKEINITFERKDFKIDDAKKASTFYFNDANSPAGNAEAEIVEIPQRADMIEALQAAGESTDNIEDYDLSDISLKEDGTADKIQMEGRRSTIYGCYVEDQKPEEVVTPTEPEKDETKKEDTKKEDTKKEDTKKEDTKTEEKKEESAAQTMTYENDDVTVTVTADAEGVIPKDSKLQVVPILKDQKDTKAQYKEVEEQLNKKAEDEEYDIAGFLAYDISFVDKDGKEVEPNKGLGNVKVLLEYKQKTIPEEVDTSEETNLDVTVMHLEENANGEIKDVVDMVADTTKEAAVETTANAEVTKAEFVTDSFSYYTITWKNTWSASFKLYFCDTDGNILGDSTNVDKSFDTSTTYSLSNCKNWFSETGYTYKKAAIGTNNSNNTKATLSTYPSEIYRIKYSYSYGTQYSTAKSGNSGWSNLGNNNIYLVYESTAYKFYDFNGNLLTNSSYKTLLDAMITDVEENPNVSITNWKRSSKYVNLPKTTKESEDKINNNWKWNSLSASLPLDITDASQVWDGSRLNSAGQVKHNYNDYINRYGSGANQLRDTVSAYGGKLLDSATWKLGDNAGGDTSSMYRFRGEFTIPADMNPNEYSFTLDQVTPGNSIYINDDVYVFVYPKDVTLTNDNFMDYLAFWTGTANQYQSEAISFHGRIGTKVVQSTDNNDNKYSDYSKVTDGWQMEAVEDNAANTILNAYNQNETRGFYVDVITDDYAGGGGMYRLKMDTRVQTRYPVEFTKVDAIDMETPVAGAKFELDQVDSDGKATGVHYDTTSGNDGKVTVNVVAGTYIMTETAPTGYYQPNGNWTVTVSSNGNYTIRWNGATTGNNASNITGSQGSYKVSNKSSVRGNYSFKKVNSKGAGLSGAEFTMTTQSGTTTIYTSGSDGIVKISDLLVGTYTVTETKAPSGLIASTDTWVIEVASDGTTTMYKQGDETKTKVTQVVNYTEKEQTLSTLTNGKTAKVVDEANRVFQIDLSAAVTGREEGEEATAVSMVLVLDASASMNENGKSLQDVKKAANSLIDKIYTASPDSEIAVIWYNGGTAGYSSLDGLADSTGFKSKNNVANLTNAIIGKSASGGTPMDVALKKAYKEVKENAQYDNKYVVFFTDGMPGHTTSTSYENWNCMIANGANNYASKIKSTSDGDAILYTVGYGLSENDKFKWHVGDSDSSTGYEVHSSHADMTGSEYLSGKIATQGKDAAGKPYAYSASDSDKLLEAFDSIAATVGSLHSLAAKSIVDVIDSRFELTAASEAALKAKYGNDISIVRNQDGTTTITWTGDFAIVKNKQDGGWSASLQVKAKEDFIGGNMVPTNGAGSGIVVDDETFRTFPSPSVNVKLLEPSIGEKEITLYKGDTIESSGFAEEVYKTFNVKELDGTTTLSPDSGLTEITGIKGLTAEELTALTNGTTIRKDYAYPGTTDVVGHFEYAFAPATDENGAPQGIVQDHGATEVENHVEKYQLVVKFVPNAVADRIKDLPETNQPTDEGGTVVTEKLVTGNYWVNVLARWNIIKRSASNHDNLLGGAEFELKLNNTTKYYGVSSETTGAVKWYTDANHTAENLIDLYKMEPGTYTMEETKAPMGYAAYKGNWTVVIGENGLLTSIKSGNDDVVKEESSDYTDAYYYFDNTVLYELPNSGGIGIFWYMISGILLMLAATLILYKNKKHEGVLKK